MTEARKAKPKEIKAWLWECANCDAKNIVQRRPKGENVKCYKCFALSEVAEDRKVPYKAILQSYNDCLGDSLPTALKVTPPRRGQMGARCREAVARYEILWWEEYWRRVRQVPHLMGDNKRGWTANFDWLLNPTNMNKVLEGHYGDNRGRGKKQRLEGVMPLAEPPAPMPSEEERRKVAAKLKDLMGSLSRKARL